MGDKEKKTTWIYLFLIVGLFGGMGFGVMFDVWEMGIGVGVVLGFIAGIIADSGIFASKKPD